MLVLWCLCIVGSIEFLAGSPITNPLRSDEDIGLVIPEHFDSKRTKNYHSLHPNTSVAAQETQFGIEHGMASEFSLRWSTSVGSPVYAAPVIFPSGANGRKQVFVNTFYQYAELVDCEGYKSWGWPLSFEDSSFQGSPMVYDVDGDGNIDMGMVDKNGNMFWVRIGESGEYLEDYHVQVPKLRVKRDWAAGLDANFVDSYVKLSMFDRSNPQEEGRGGAGKGGAMRSARLDDLQAVPPAAATETGGRRRLSADWEEGQHQSEDALRFAGHVDRAEDNDASVPEFGEGLTDDFVRLEAERLQGNQLMYGMSEEDEGEEGEEADAGGAARLEDILNFDSVPPEGLESVEAEGAAMDGAYEYGYRMAPKRAHGGHRTGYGAGAYYAGGGGWAAVNESDYVMVDAHVLASPTLADINGDGHMEVVLSVSYYFDKAEYAGTQPGFEPDGYVAGGLACWDLDAQRWTWLVHLDLTTAKSKYQAMIYAAPTVADLDGDGRSEIVVGTAMGLLYVMDGESGFVRRFFPMQFNSIQAQVSVADVVGDGRLEMIVLDMGGTVAVVDLEGAVLWDAHLSGTLPFPATVGDVDGDGILDVVVVAATEGKSSHIYALRGDTGAPLPGYPITLPGGAAVSSPVLLVDLVSAQAATSTRRTNASFEDLLEAHSRSRSATDGTSSLLSAAMDDPFPEGLLAAAKAQAHRKTVAALKGLHLVVTAHEGSIYIIYGQPTAQLVAVGSSRASAAEEVKKHAPHHQEGELRFHAQRLDVGEHIYSVPLIDDISGDGYMDLLVGTLNGQLLLFESSIPHLPSNSWTSFPNHRLNSITHGAVGVAVPSSEKERLRQYDIKGRDILELSFEVWDKRFTTRKERAEAESPSETGVEYSVSITRGTNRLNPAWQLKVDRPGKYTARIPVSPPELSLFVVSMKTSHGEYFEDSVHVALSTRFYIWIKYLVCTPMALLAFTIISRFRKYLF